MFAKFCRGYEFPVLRAHIVRPYKYNRGYSFVGLLLLVKKNIIE